MMLAANQILYTNLTFLLVQVSVFLFSFSKSEYDLACSIVDPPCTPPVDPVNNTMTTTTTTVIHKLDMFAQLII